MRLTAWIVVACGAIAGGVGLAAWALRETGVRVTQWVALHDLVEEIE